MELWDRLGTPIVNKKRCATLELKRLEAEAVAIKPFFSMVQFPEYAEGKRKLNTDDSPGARQPDDNCREGVASVPSVAKPSTLKDGHCPQSATLITGLAIVTDKKWQSASPAYLVGPTMPVHPKPIPTEKSRRIALAAEKMKLHAAAAACLQEMLETSRFMNPMDRLLYIRDNSHKFVTSTNGSAVLQELVTGKGTVEYAAINDGSYELAAHQNAKRRKN